MSTVADITVSVDGFVTGPDPGADRGLGVGGEALHRWALDSDDPVDAAILHESTAATGAVVMGRRLFDIVDGPQGWNDTRGYGADEAGRPGRPPLVVVTHRSPTEVRLTHDLTFVTTGVADAVAAARDSAGDLETVVMGGADVLRQCVDAGLVDVLRLHIAPLLLGAGTPLFIRAVRRELRDPSVRASKHATHITWRVG
jgi:dihydrofolate reductase